MTITRETMPRIAEIVDEARQRVQEARLAQSTVERQEKLSEAQRAVNELKSILSGDEHA